MVALRRHLPLVIVLGAFAASRGASYAAGVRFDSTQLDHAVQNLDPALLRHHLVESLYYLHAQPPLWNAFLGIVLKLFGGHAQSAFAVAFVVLGLVESIALLTLLARLGVGARLRTVVTVVIVCSPSFLVYENWLFYDYPTMVALTLAALALQSYLARPTLLRGLAFFGWLAAIIFLRSVFQLVWLLLALLVVVLARPNHRRRTLLAAALPLVLVCGLYVKNAALFGVPSTSSWFGINLARITVAQLPAGERSALVREGKLHRVSLVQPFSPLSDYERAGALPRTTHRGVPALDQSTRANGEANLNNVAYIGISRRYLSDGLWVIRHRPGTYLHGVKRGVEDFLQPATHLLFTTSNRKAIAAYDNTYNKLVYGSIGQTNLAGITLGLLYLIAFLAGLAPTLRVLPRRATAAEATLAFAWVTIVYTIAIGTLTDVGENARFRFPIDPLAAALVAVAAMRVWRQRRSLFDSMSNHIANSVN